MDPPDPPPASVPAGPRVSPVHGPRVTKAMERSASTPFRTSVGRLLRAFRLDGLGEFLPIRTVYAAAFGSLGSPSTRSPMMFRWISPVPPQMVSDREKKKDAWRSLTG